MAKAGTPNGESKQMKTKPVEKLNLTVEVVELTPDRAREYLEANVNYQRGLSRTRVEKMAEEIIAGNWMFTGQPIIINEHGEMIDGQHRCAAVILADVPIDVLVVEGVEGVAFQAIDTGKNRSGADVLKIAGYKNVTLSAAIIRCIISYQRKGEFHAAKHTQISPMQTLEFMRLNEQTFVPLVTWYTSRIKEMRILSIGSALPALHWLATQEKVPATLIDEFVEKLLFGDNLKKADPVYQFREALIYSQSHPSHRILLRNKTARLIKTWNAFRKGEAGQGLTNWNALREDYPEIVFKVR